MNPYHRLFTMAGAITVLTACGGSPPPPPVSPAPPKPAAAPAPATPVSGAPTAPARPGTPGPVAAAPSGQPAMSVAQQTSAAARAAAEVLAAKGTGYERRGRRDPFENLEVAAKEAQAREAQAREAAAEAAARELREREKEAASAAARAGWNVSGAKLTGIVRGQVTLALIETSGGMGYILKTGDTLGEGRLVEIGADQVTFSLPPRPGSATNRVVLKIPKE